MLVVSLLVSLKLIPHEPSGDLSGDEIELLVLEQGIVTAAMGNRGTAIEDVNIQKHTENARPY